jgi:hypothetical protein
VAEEKDIIYDGPPVWAKLTGAVLLGVGGIVLLPIAALRGDWWLLVFAVPLLVVGLLLLALRLCVAVERQAGVVLVTQSFVGLRLREHRYRPSEISALEIARVAGDEAERASDTWYVKMWAGRRGYTVGRYDTRVRALLARRDLDELLQGLRQGSDEEAEIPATETRPAHRLGAAQKHYKTGIALFSAGDRDGAREEFGRALAMASEPLMRRMIEQRLKELDRR